MLASIENRRRATPDEERAGRRTLFTRRFDSIAMAALAVGFAAAQEKLHRIGLLQTDDLIE